MCGFILGNLRHWRNVGNGDIHEIGLIFGNERRRRNTRERGKHKIRLV
jgi:hypothetical protein